MHLSRRIAAAVCLLLPALALTAGYASAQAWPSKPISIVVAYPPGGDTDAIARVYAEKLSQRVGQPVLIDNRPGASGTIGNAWVMKAPADGYTLLFTPSTFPIAQHVLKVGANVAHDVNRDFTPIVKTGNIPLLLVTAPSTGLRSVEDVVAAAKAGKPVAYGTPGTGSPMHIVGELFNKDAGVNITHTPYKGVGPVVNDALGGHVTLGWITPGAVAAHVRSGALLPLAVAEPKRTRLLPEVPTLMEKGYAHTNVSAWMGLLGPKGLPADVVAALNGHMNAILAMPDVQARMAALGIEPTGGEPSALAQQIADDDRRYGAVVKEFNIRAD